MKTKLGIVFAVLTMILAAFAQKPSDLYQGLKYDKSTEATVSATVDAVQEFECPVSQAYGHHVAVKTVSGQMVVHTAPVKYLQDMGGWAVRQGDSLEIVGSKVKDAAGRETMLAREVTWRNETFRFRDKEGNPLWRPSR
jgi:hypothetical protein